MTVNIIRLPMLKERCPRCNGNLYLETIREVKCLQCGYSREVKVVKRR